MANQHEIAPAAKPKSYAKGNRLMRTPCFICKKYRTLTIEHIIPQSIGGKLKEKLYCKKCNGTLGHTLDDEISKQLGCIATLLNIKRAQGKRQPYEVKKVTDRTTLTFDGKNLKRKEPIVKITSSDGKKLDSADITARSEKELKEICKSIKKRYEMLSEIKTFKDVHPGPTDVEHEMTIDNALLCRAVSKISYSFLCIKLPKDDIFSPPFDAVREYIKAASVPALACANFVHTQFMTDYSRPLHKIHVALNRREKLVVGYVSLFGFLRFTVLLSNNFESRFEWPGIDYTFDPVRCEQVFGNDNFRVPQLKINDIIQPKQSKEFISSELNKGYEIISSCVENYKFLGGELTNK